MRTQTLIGFSLLCASPLLSCSQSSTVSPSIDATEAALAPQSAVESLVKDGGGWEPELLVPSSGDLQVSGSVPHVESILAVTDQDADEVDVTASADTDVSTESGAHSELTIKKRAVASSTIPMRVDDSIEK